MRQSIDQYDLGRPSGSNDILHPSQSAATLINPMAASQSRADLSDSTNHDRSNKDNAKRVGDEGDDGQAADEPNEFQSPKTAGEKAQKPENGEATKKDTPVTDLEAEKGSDPNLVTWYSQDDKENP